jgi:hypothetical protein
MILYLLDENIKMDSIFVLDNMWFPLKNISCIYEVSGNWYLVLKGMTKEFIIYNKITLEDIKKKYLEYTINLSKEREQKKRL